MAEILGIASALAIGVSACVTCCNYLQMIDYVESNLSSQKYEPEVVCTVCNESVNDEQCKKCLSSGRLIIHYFPDKCNVSHLSVENSNVSGIKQVHDIDGNMRKPPTKPPRRKSRESIKSSQESIGTNNEFCEIPCNNNSYTNQLASVQHDESSFKTLAQIKKKDRASRLTTTKINSKYKTKPLCTCNVLNPCRKFFQSLLTGVQRLVQSKKNRTQISIITK